VISLVGGNAYAPLVLFFFALAGAAFVVEGWALIDAVLRPPAAYLSAGKKTKNFWLLILTPAFVFGTVGFLLSPSLYLSGLSILFIAAFVASAVYLTDVRPKIKEFRQGGGGTGYGPYGPW
jgi:hypothetical protein